VFVVVNIEKQVSCTYVDKFMLYVHTEIHSFCFSCSIFIN